MSHLSVSSHAPVRPSLSAPPRRHDQRPGSPTARMRTDGLSLSASAALLSSGEAVHALALFRNLAEHGGGSLHGDQGQSLTPQEAVERLANGLEVVAKVPATGGARSTSALFFSLEDVKPLTTKLA